LRQCVVRIGRLDKRVAAIPAVIAPHRATPIAFDLAIKTGWPSRAMRDKLAGYFCLRIFDFKKQRSTRNPEQREGFDHGYVDA
jgi:hypothetical protein